MPALPSDVVDALARMGLASRDEVVRGEALSGGVSSEIYRVDLARGPVCVKRALPRLKTAALWEAPVERNRYERAWLEVAARVVPGHVPAVLGHDDEAGLFVMTWFEPATHPVWKHELRDGRIDTVFAAALGDRLGRVHATTADDTVIAAQFDTAELFTALRLEPYFVAAARAIPDAAPLLDRVRIRTASTRRALVHGDVSPKNILVGAAGPVLLDAECATFGDPAFDLAFCASHLMLKCVWRPPHTGRYMAALDEVVSAYLRRVDWEPAGGVDERAADLALGLVLARVAGTSLVEYLDDEERALVASRVLSLWSTGEPFGLGFLRRAWTGLCTQ